MSRSRSTLLTAAAGAALLALTTVGAVQASATGPSPAPLAEVTGNIVGGQYDTEVAGAVSLSRSTTPGAGFFCSATRIGPQWVLTATHCAEVGPKRAYTNNLQRTTGDFGTVVAMYDAPSGDVTLLKLDSTPAGDIVPYASRGPAVGAEVVMRGWGMTDADGAPSLKLKSATGTYQGTGTNPFYGGTDYVVQGKSGITWKGDSGGPLMYQNKVVGAASWSRSYGTTIRTTTGYGAVPPLASWIQETTGIAPDGADTTTSTSTTTPTSTGPTSTTTPTSTRPTSTTTSPGTDPALLEGTVHTWAQVKDISTRRPVVIAYYRSDGGCARCLRTIALLKELNAADGGSWTLVTVNLNSSAAYPVWTGNKIVYADTVDAMGNGQLLTSKRLVGEQTRSSLRTWLDMLLA